MKDSYVFQVGSSNYEGLVGPYLWEKLSFVKLVEIMRQKDDQNFALALNNLANRGLTQDDVSLFASRQFQEESIGKLPKKAIHLFTTNVSVNAHNEAALDALSTEGCKFTAIDSLVGENAGQLTDKLRDTIKALSVSDTLGLPYELYLKIGARYLMTINKDTPDGLVNGATGVLQYIVYGIRKETQEQVPRMLWIQFDDCTIGENKRLSYRGAVPKGI